ncbi:MAG: alkylmercury lyase family protein [Thiotrichales bacterium]
MSDFVLDSVRHLNELLPLKARQDQLSPALKALHRAIIESLVARGRAPSRAEVAEWVGEDQVDNALVRLGADDLIVLAADRREILGAYPVTSETTPHTLQVNATQIHAMCALDALSVGPMYELPVVIQSRCRVTGDAIQIKQAGARILSATPATTRVGVRWQAPTGSAAHSLCMEMVFLRDDAAAATWHGDDTEYHSVFTLDEAVDFGARYFRPLL